MIHSMRSMKGRKGFMAIKIDFEKASDRVKWSFILDCSRELNIPGGVIDLLEWCISSPSLQILWNCSKLVQFNPSRGLRQGDPISPYLFVIGMEILAHLIQEQMNKGEWEPIKLNKEWPSISHLFLQMILFCL